MRTPAIVLTSSLAILEALGELRCLAIVDSLHDSARAAMRQFEYRTAFWYVEQAKALAPADRRIRDLRHELGAILGEVEDPSAERRIGCGPDPAKRRDEARRRAETFYLEGEEALRARRLADARAALDKAADIIDWSPYEMNLGDLRERIDGLKAKAGEGGD